MEYTEIALDGVDVLYLQRSGANRTLLYYRGRVLRLAETAPGLAALDCLASRKLVVRR